MSSSVGSEDEAELARALNFLAADPLYETVKPFVFRNRPADGFPVTNVKDDIATVPIRDMRSQEMTYEKNGFCWRDVPTAMTRHDYEDPDRIRDIHIPELEAYLKDFFQASQARIVNYRHRKRHPKFPIATGTGYEYEQPAYRAHIDLTHETCKRSLREFLGAEANELLDDRDWQYVNIWHPLSGPLYDWPLALCDIATVSARDTVPVDVLDGSEVECTSHTNEEFMLHNSSTHRWYYLPGQMPTELLIFKTAESRTREGQSSGTPHSAFDLNTPHKCSTPRESLELRAFVCW